MTEHAPFAPSSAARWIGCAGSHQAELAAGPRPSSPWADEGSAAHEIFADALRRKVSPYQLTSDPVLAAPLHEAFTAAMQLIVGSRYLVEQRLPPLPGLPDIWGTADLVVFDARGRVAMVIDLKFGTGVVVEADTVQLGVYALLAAQQWGASFEGVTAVILQPRALHQAGWVRQHDHSIDALNALLALLRTAVAAAGQLEAPRTAGHWCRFCAARPRCPDHHRMLAQEAPSTWGIRK